MIGRHTLRTLAWMARGKMDAERELFLTLQEDEWERYSQLAALIYNRTCFSKEDTAKDPDDFNLWLMVPGVEGPTQEQIREGDKIIAERKRAIEAKQKA